jgi:hypothetical protein
MIGMTRMKAVVCLSLFLVVSAVIPAEERGRGLYVDYGLGFGSVKYFSGNTKSTADHFRDDAVIGITP